GMGCWLAATAGARRSMAVLAAIACAALLLVGLLDRGDLGRRLQTIPALEGEGVAASRLTIARDTLRMATDRPWLGWGLGTFSAVYPQYRSFPIDLLVDHAHNDYVEMLAETGLLGACIIF